MNKFILNTIKNGTQGLDTQVNLRLEVMRNGSPTRLSEFYGGVAELYDGYSTTTIEYTITLTDYDKRRIKLTSNDGSELELSPEFIRCVDPKDPLNQLHEVPLKDAGNLSGYTITNLNWGLK